MLNVAVIMGRLTADPELKHTNGGIAVCSFTLAVDRAHTKDGERTTDFLNVVAWRQTAEFVSKYFRKGQLVAVNGSIQVRDYVDRENIKRRTYEIVADNVHFAEPKRQESQGQSYAPPPNNTGSAGYGEQQGFTEISGSDDEDSLPF